MVVEWKAFDLLWLYFYERQGACVSCIRSLRFIKYFFYLELLHVLEWEREYFKCFPMNWWKQLFPLKIISLNSQATVDFHDDWFTCPSFLFEFHQSVSQFAFNRRQNTSFHTKSIFVPILELVLWLTQTLPQKRITKTGLSSTTLKVTNALKFFGDGRSIRTWNKNRPLELEGGSFVLCTHFLFASTIRFASCWLSNLAPYICAILCQFPVWMHDFHCASAHSTVYSVVATVVVAMCSPVSCLFPVPVMRLPCTQFLSAIIKCDLFKFVCAPCRLI